VRAGTSTAPVEQTTVVLMGGTADAQRRLAAVLPGAVLLQGAATQADAPVQIFLGKKP